MASPANILTKPSSIPCEIFQEICQYLDGADLKRFRLASKVLSFAAELFLFRQVLLRRYVESFERFQQIADHHRFSKLVKAITYDGVTMSRFAGPCPDFDDWFKHFHNAQDRSILQDDTMRRRNRMIQEYIKSLRPDQLVVQYQNYCSIYHSEQFMRWDETKIQDLTNALAKLPRLEEVYFDFHEAEKPTHVDQMSFAYRHVIVAPTYWRTGESYARDFVALLKVARTIPKPLKIVKAIGLPWSYFQRTEEISALTTSTTAHCQHLALEVGMIFARSPSENSNDAKRAANVGRMFLSAPFLETLEISFGLEQPYYHYELTLDEVFGSEAHWPNLKRLKLSGLKADTISLSNLLTTHAATLRSLELIRIRFTRMGNNFWCNFIMLLQTALNLKSIRIGRLGPTGVKDTYEDIPSLCARKWLKGLIPFPRCIEHFIVHGNPCPFTMPHEPENSGDWECPHTH